MKTRPYNHTRLLIGRIGVLEKALHEIEAYVPKGFVSPMDDEDSLSIRAIARNALNQEPENREETS